MLDIPQRRHERIRYRDEAITLDDYQFFIRQQAVDPLGPERPTLFLSNGFMSLDMAFIPRSRVSTARLVRVKEFDVRFYLFFQPDG